MSKVESPATRAYWQLADLAREAGDPDGQLFALTWLAAARMIATKNTPALESVDALVEPDSWKQVVEAGLPAEAVDFHLSGRAPSPASDIGRRAKATAVVVELTRELGTHAWDVLPCLSGSTGGRRQAEGVLVPELASLLMDMVEAPSGAEIWIPFDPRGQLTVEALRRGWHVLTASPLEPWQLVQRLLLSIETGSPSPATVRTEVDRDAAGRPLARADYAVVVPPFGMPVRDSRLSLWDITGTRAYEQYARSETWALFEFANRVAKRAVFVTPQGVLFSKGQEQRLREYLLHRGGEVNELQTVVALPPGVFGATNIAGAIVVLDPGSGADAVFMVDISSGRRSVTEAGEVVSTGQALVLGREETKKSRLVSRDEISENELSFAPSRYLRRVSDLGDESVKLGDICEVIRPPTITRESTPFEVAEVGLSDLHQWKPISGELDKTVFLKSPARESTLVKRGDVVLSIKGTVGRASLMGDAAAVRPTVVSQSCLALRISENNRAPSVTPEVLFMYLRSPHGQAQLASLQVGAGVQHISPGTLMSALSIPIPTYEMQTAIRRDFLELCDLEHRISGLQHRVRDIATSRWPEDVL